MTYLVCQERKTNGTWVYDFWATENGNVPDALPLSIWDMIEFVGILARQSKADVMLACFRDMFIWQNGVLVS